MTSSEALTWKANAEMQEEGEGVPCKTPNTSWADPKTGGAMARDRRLCDIVAYDFFFFFLAGAQNSYNLRRDPAAGMGSEQGIFAWFRFQEPVGYKAIKTLRSSFSLGSHPLKGFLSACLTSSNPT